MKEERKMSKYDYKTLVSLLHTILKRLKHKKIDEAIELIEDILDKLIDD